MAVNHDDSRIRTYAQDHAVNMCSFMVRVDGEELEVPFSFGMTADEIRDLYPFVLQFSSVKVPNPSVKFMQDAGAGVYGDDREAYEDAKKRAFAQAVYWCGKPEASLMELAVRLAFDIKLRGMQTLIGIFGHDVSAVQERGVKPDAKKADVPVVPKGDAESDAVDEPVQEDDIEKYIPDGEQDIPIGIAGSVNVDIYGAGDDSYVSDDLDRMERAGGPHDDFHDDFMDMVAGGDEDGTLDTVGLDDSVDKGITNMTDQSAVNALDDTGYIVDLYGSMDSGSDELTEDMMGDFDGQGDLDEIDLDDEGADG